VFASAAYLGDVAPFVGPANRLVERGHDVTFLTPRGFHRLLEGERFGLATYPLDFSPAGMRADPTHERLLHHPWVNQVRLGRYWMRQGLVADPSAGRGALLETLKDADVLVTHPTLGSATVPVAQHLGVPAVVGQLFPMMMPTGEWGPPFPVGNHNMGSVPNRLAWRAFAWTSGVALHDRAMNRHRRSLGVPPLRGTALLSWTEAARTVVLVSRHYFGAPPSDWTHWPLVGFSAWPGPSGQPVDERVDQYLDSGEPPVLVCLGTSAAAGAARTFATIASGLHQRGLRTLLLVGEPANLAHVRDQPGAFEFAPVASVVGRCAAAVVSGALGTVAAALTAGVPVVVFPQLFDQLWHGRRVEELGVGLMVTRASKVAAAVSELLENPVYRQRAHALALELQTEDGAAALVDVVEATISTKS
jgi:UDP:flavonoid glycosyltransferase YjiC (YdhE family)